MHADNRVPTMEAGDVVQYVAAKIIVFLRRKSVSFRRNLTTEVSTFGN